MACLSGAAEAVSPALRTDPELCAYCARLRIKKGSNVARVATARRLLTMVYCVLSQERLYERREVKTTTCSAPAALITS